MNILKLFSKYADKEWILIDVSYVRVHQHSAGITGQDISKSIGGNSLKIHLAKDTYCNSIRIIMTDGTTHDAKTAADLIQKIDLSEIEILCADKGYDSEDICDQVERTHTHANISRKSNSLKNNDYIDWYLYKIRYLEEWQLDMIS